MIASEDYKGASAKVSALEPELEAARQAAEEAEAEADALEAARAAALAEEEAASRRAKACAAESIARAKELRESSEANNILLNECAEKIYRIGQRPRRSFETVQRDAGIKKEGRRRYYRECHVRCRKSR